VNFICSHCSYCLPVWRVYCPRCGSSKLVALTAKSEGRRVEAAPVTALGAIGTAAPRRLSTGLLAFDQVLGGGLVRGALTLLAGSPGAGKSRLALQSAAYIASSVKTLYIAGEETAERLAQRAEELELADAGAINVTRYCELVALSRIVRAERPALIVADSLQVLHSTRLRSRVGSPSQLVMAARTLRHWAQSLGACVLLIAHVSREDTVAGPRTIEHDVDVVLSFRVASGGVRLLIATKNRFGPAMQLQRMTMGELGVA
jgi:DNA repair protein RadA/Sms